MIENIFDYNTIERELSRWGVVREYGHYEEQLAFFKDVLTSQKQRIVKQLII
jgi:hypothetical protein